MLPEEEAQRSSTTAEEAVAVAEEAAAAVLLLAAESGAYRARICSGVASSRCRVAVTVQPAANASLR